MTASRRRRAFTLVELLVVTGLMAALLGLVVSGLRPNAQTQVRQLSQELSSALIAVRTRAMTATTGAGIMLEPGSGAIPVRGCTTGFFATMPAFITGTSGTTGMPPAVLSATSTTVTLFPTNADLLDLASGYKIRFQRQSEPSMPASPWFAFMHTSGSSGIVSFRSGAGQTMANTVWPVLSGTGALEFTMGVRPVKASAAIGPTKLAAIDLRFSGVGNSQTAAYGTLHDKGAIWLVFDREGGVDGVMVSGTGAAPTLLPLVPASPIYLLVASLADIQQDRSLQSESSRWLAIAPATGRVTVASNVVVSGTTDADLNAARANALQAVGGGAK